MAVRVRLTRVGSKKNAIWRVVVADQRSPRDGRSIETIGHYNPQTHPSTIVLDRERLDHWLARGAVPSDQVRKLMRAKPDGSNVPEAEAPPAPVKPPADESPDAGAQAQVDPPADSAGLAETETEGPAEPAPDGASEQA